MLVQGGARRSLPFLGGRQRRTGLGESGQGGLVAGTGGGDPPPGAGERLAPIGRLALEPGELPFGGVLGVLGVGAFARGACKSGSGGPGGVGQPGLLDGGLLGAALELIRIGPPGGEACRGEPAHALGGDVGQRGQRPGSAGQLLPRAGGAGQTLSGGGLDGGELGQAGAGGPIGLLDGGPAAVQELFVLVAGLKEGLGLDDIVGQQAGGGVTHLDLNGAGPSGDGGLTGQRPQLTAQLSGQVGQAGEVGGHGVELAQGPLPAAAVLEDAGGFFDEAAPVIGGGAQDGVEPALTDDDVHLSPQARIAQQLLNVQKAAGRAVDPVLGAAAAEEGAGDGDLGVVDGQGAIGVVDGQGDLGAPQRRARAGPGEDDVGHGPAAQGLGALLPHDPGQGIHDIGLAGPVGPYYGGDAGLQTQSRRRGEGLESLHRQRLEVHAHTIVGRHRGGRHPLRTVPHSLLTDARPASGYSSHRARVGSGTSAASGRRVVIQPGRRLPPPDGRRHRPAVDATASRRRSSWSHDLLTSLCRQ